MAKLYFRYGAMGSSKSANILMVRYNYEERGQYAVLLKPRTDNRDGEHEIKSRIGLEAPAEYVDEFLKEISETWSADSGEYRYHGKKVDAVLIDEAQFLSPEEVDTLSDIVDFYGIPVLCYGLRADFQTHLFPGSRRLMEIADIIEEVPTVCWCGRRAQCNTSGFPPAKQPLNFIFCKASFLLCSLYFSIFPLFQNLIDQYKVAF